MTDTRKEFEQAMKAKDYGFSNFIMTNGKYNWPMTEACYQVWKACQSLNDKRIEQLLAVIAKKDEALSAVDDLIEHQYCGSKDAMTDLQIACDMTHEALALQPSDVELSDIGYISEDGAEVFLTKGLQIDAETCGVPVTKLYTIKTKANTK